MPVIRFIVHWTGSDYGQSYGQFSPYDFLSGFAGLSLLGLMIHHYRLHNCHQKRCLRIGRFRTADGKPACRHHHGQERGG